MGSDSRRLFTSVQRNPSAYSWNGSYQINITVSPAPHSGCDMEKKIPQSFFTEESLDQSHDYFFPIENGATAGFSESEIELCLPLVVQVRGLVIIELLCDPQLSWSCQWAVHCADWSHTNTQFIALTVRPHTHTRVHTFTVIQTLTFIQTEHTYKTTRGLTNTLLFWCWRFSLRWIMVLFTYRFVEETLTFCKTDVK